MQKEYRIVTKIRRSWRSLLDYLEEHEKVVSFLIFVLGFIYDLVTLRRIDQTYDIAVLAFHLTVVSVSILIIHLQERNRYNTIRDTDEMVEKRTEQQTWFHFFMQFSFGGLFSSYMIFYSQSATFIGSWPFLIFLVILFIGNEFLRKHYVELTFQLSILYFCLFSYSIFTIPIMLGKIGKGIFILSGVISLAVFICFCLILTLTSPRRIRRAALPLTLSVFGIYIFFNSAYFLNIIPPVPLSLKEIGIYHTVMKDGDGNYNVQGEDKTFVQNYLGGKQTVHEVAGEPIYVFAAVFAPTNLTTHVSHQWSKYDEKTKEWVRVSSVRFAILGGRDNGYRGYSLIRNATDGEWRVDVLTDDGLLIGRKSFTVQSVDAEPILISEVK